MFTVRKDYRITFAGNTKFYFKKNYMALYCINTIVLCQQKKKK